MSTKTGRLQITLEDICSRCKFCLFVEMGTSDCKHGTMWPGIVESGVFVSCLFFEEDEEKVELYG